MRKLIFKKIGPLIKRKSGSSSKLVHAQRFIIKAEYAMHMLLLFLFISQVPTMGISDVIIADPAESYPTYSLGLIILTEFGAMVLLPEYVCVPDLDLNSISMLAVELAGF